MIVSIITACYNSAPTIEQTIQSVLDQDCPNLEYLVIDGQSTDHTLEIVKKYGSRISRLVSEKDGGIYDALNKGISLAKGDIVGILHSDDVYTSGMVISKVVDAFSRFGTDSVYGDLQYVSREKPSEIVRDWKSGPYRRAAFRRGWMPPHPTFFLKRECYTRYGGFRLELRSSADYELMLRMLYVHGLSASYLPEVIVRMKTGGQSNSSLANRIRANREDRLAWKLNGLKADPLTLLLKPISKLRQYF